MSRIGRQPIDVASNVSIDIDKGNRVTVKGPKGTLVQQFSPDMEIVRENGQVVVNRPTDMRHHRSLHGLTRSLLNNMVIGVTAGFSQRMEIHGTGYRAEPKGKNLALQVGKSHPVEFEPPTPDVSFDVAKDGRSFIIHGIDKSVVGQLAAVIRKSRPPEPYKGKGIRYEGEYVRSKAGKAGRAA